MSDYMFSAIKAPTIPDDRLLVFLDTRGRLHILDLAKASDVSKIASIDDRISRWWLSSKSGGNVNLAASQTVSLDVFLPDSMTVMNARSTPSWKAALLAIWRKTSIFSSVVIAKLPFAQRWRESACRRKTKRNALVSAERSEKLKGEGQQ